MNKSAIQKFAVWARDEMMKQVQLRAYQYGVEEGGQVDADADAVNGRLMNPEEKMQRRELIAKVKEKGFPQLMEEAAYTWFNRLIALRFMEVNNYLPSHIRVFSDGEGKFAPEILKDVLHLDLDGLDRAKVADYVERNDNEALYRYLLLTQCNALNDALPQMFERLGGYMELLCPGKLLGADSVARHMVEDIPQEDWQDAVQIIGWMYQYYISEKKAEVFANLKKNIKINKDTIPAATQLFTPEWIVRYMVENSLGRLWIERHPNPELRATWKYYVDEAEQEPEVAEQLKALVVQTPVNSPEDIKLIDPCMGSGHILVYAFDVLMQIYDTCGYDKRDAVQSILTHNLYGLDIDDRAAQLAYFAVMMKARQYERRIFGRDLQPKLYAIRESNEVDEHCVAYVAKGNAGRKEAIETIVREMHDAKEYGSILKVSQVDFADLFARFAEIERDADLMRGPALGLLWPVVRVAELLARRYDVVVTNPPYMGSGNMDAKLSGYVKKYYPDSKNDLFAVFIERCGAMTQQNGFQAMITQHAWMFLSSYEKLREKIMQHSIINMAHLGARGFEEIGGEVVQTTTFVIAKSYISDFNAEYVRLVEFNSQQAKEDAFVSGNNRFIAKQEHFDKIPGKPIIYTLSDDFYRIFDNDSVELVSESRCGMNTGDNDAYIRLWHEVNNIEMNVSAASTDEFHRSLAKYAPYNKGGKTRKWYGNSEYLLKFDSPHYKALLHQGNHLPSRDFYFRPAVTWSDVTTQGISFRYQPHGSVFDGSAAVAFVISKRIYFLLGYLNTKIVNTLAQLLNPTLHFKLGDYAKIPYKDVFDESVELTAQNCIGISKADWDANETSWDFQRHPLLTYRTPHRFYSDDEVVSYELADSYENWKVNVEARFEKLKSNEEALNRIFINIYGLQNELTPDVADKDITIARIYDSKEDIPESMKGNNYVLTKADVVKSFISYGIGCMLGRYSLDTPGLAYAGGEWDAGKYKTFQPDADNILPICDDEYFDDDIVGRFVDFVRAAFGEGTLDENLRFIGQALGNGGTPREVLRKYFLNDFYPHHLKTYQKRPIYWMVDSGKKNGFKALIYMHRYQSDLLARIRTDYVHEQQERYRTQLVQIADALDHATPTERVKLTKTQKRIQEQTLEIQKFEEKIHHLADQNIEIDLDDGVKHNYALFGDVLAKIK